MSLYKILQNMPDTGSLRVDVTDQDGRPIDGATAEISITGEPETTLESIQTDSNGQTESVELPADRKSTRLNSSHRSLSRMPSSA